MEVNKLDKDELLYELKIRGYVGLNDCHEMQMLLRSLLKTEDNSLENYVVLDAQEEIKVCVNKIRELKVLVDNIEGSKMDESYRTADTKLCHLLARIDRITTNDENLLKTRSLLLKGILQLMKEMENKSSGFSNPVKPSDSNIVPVSRTLIISKSNMPNKLENDHVHRSRDEDAMELFTNHGVALKKCGNEFYRDPVSGTLSVLQYREGKCFEWKANEVSFDSESTDADWHVVDAVRRRTCSTSSNVETCQLAPTIRIPIEKLKLYKIKEGGRQISLVDISGTRYSFIFQCGNSDRFIEVLRIILRTRRAGRSRHTFIVIQPRTEPSQPKSFSELNLFPEYSDRSPNVWNFVKSLRSRPYDMTMQTFSRFSALTDVILYRTPEQRPVEEVAELLTKSLHVDDKASDSDFTIIGDRDQTVNSKLTVMSSNPILTPRERFERKAPLTLAQWNSFLNSEGAITDPEAINNIIFEGGVDSSIRTIVWKYLLNYYPWSYTAAECEKLREEKIVKYLQMKKQWQTISEEQEQRFTAFRERKTLVEKDVNRTDRTMDFYAGENNPNLQTLYDILMTYVMYNFNLGYVQGMSDLLSPILYLMQSEYDAFWCFVGFMDKVCNNFELDQLGMKSQLTQIFYILEVISPELAYHLQKTESSNMFFCFRWLLVWLKREFNLEDIMSLWEVLWSNLPCPNFHLLICAAILDMEKNELIKPENGFTEILKYVNELSMKMDLNKIIPEARGIYIQLKNAGDDVPLRTRRIVGLAKDSENTSENGDEELYFNPTEVAASSVKNSDNDSIEDFSFTKESGDIGFESVERGLANHYY